MLIIDRKGSSFHHISISHLDLVCLDESIHKKIVCERTHTRMFEWMNEWTEIEIVDKKSQRSLEPKHTSFKLLN